MSTTSGTNPTAATDTPVAGPQHTRVHRLHRRALAPVFALLFGALLFGASAMAQGVVVHPFGGQDLQLGAAVAERASHVLREAGATVYGPEVAPTMIPPLVVPNGFLNPAVFLGDGGIDTLTGAELLRQTLGTSAGVTGRLQLREAELVIDLFVSTEGGPAAIHRLTAPEDAPHALATAVARTIAREAGLTRPAAVEPFSLGDAFGAYARAVTLVGAGFVVQARELLRGTPDLPPAGVALLEDLEAALGDGSGGDPVRTAVFSLAREDFQEATTIALFERFAAERRLPAVHVWLGVLATSANELDAAAAAFESAAEAYPFGVASRANFRQARGLGPVDPEELLASDRLADDAASWLAVSVVADTLGDVEAEKAALARLARAAPFFAYPFEQLSFIAFDQDEPLAAAEALAVAVELEPSSDLYWTNLGWAYYLLGFLERSEIASERAIELDPTQFIARYNLGLAHAVRDDLEAAMPQYEQALQFDPEVDDEAVLDLENAIELYPDAPAVHYALAFLYAAEGRRSDAAEQYAAFLDAAASAGRASGPYVERARRRVEALRAPPAPLEISPGATLVLGATGEPAEPFHPGDPLTPIFELYTPGDALPNTVAIELTVTGPNGAVVASSTAEVSVPPGAIGYVVDDIRVQLPLDAPTGSYVLTIRADASGDRTATAEIGFEVRGDAQAMRWLLGRNVTMQALASGSALYDVGDLPRAERLAQVLVEELRATAEAAAGAIAQIDDGRFAGLNGGEVFRQSTEADVRAFLDQLWSQGAADTSFVFVEAYAQWALDAPERP